VASDCRRDVQPNYQEIIMDPSPQAIAAETTPGAPPRWRPLDRVERRVLGVLIEKAKTTPDNYPLSLNALKNGCNQKSNRFPSMQLEEEEIEEVLERLREAGAVAVIQGGARVDKYRHLTYEWLGVNKVELAVMGELLLRGAQTVGELRGRAARMEPIKDLGELRPILESLLAKKLIVYLTPEGRGAVVSHNLYHAQELDKVRREHGEGHADGQSPSEPLPRSDSPPAWTPDKDAPAKSADARQVGLPPAAREVQHDIGKVAGQLEEFQEGIDALRAEMEALRDEATAAIEEMRRELQGVKEQIGRF
jgi:uncharacterized protein YceH (UPF0502 family)